MLNVIKLSIVAVGLYKTYKGYYKYTKRVGQRKTKEVQYKAYLSDTVIMWVLLVGFLEYLTYWNELQ